MVIAGIPVNAPRAILHGGMNDFDLIQIRPLQKIMLSFLQQCGAIYGEDDD